ncbi:MAG: DNA-binding protein WhiA [Clostridiales bacterium]|jgi:DNA-binding protein WhiA|nr:DNA-binding protein WhiA [Clostridiales bacterium]
MSFSEKVKRELISVLPPARHCRIAEMAALICGGGFFKDNNFTFRNDKTIAKEKFTAILQKDFDDEFNEKVIKATKSSFADDGLPICCIPKILITSSCCKRAFLRGAFLCAGSVNEPGCGNHLEIYSRSESYAEEIKSLFIDLELDLYPKTMQRKNRIVVYFKDGEQVSAVLGALSAFGAMLCFESKRVESNVNNQINRKVNFQNANMEKTINAAMEQTHYILKIERAVGLEVLPKHLEETARLRLAHPEYSLQEIGRALEVPAGKSSVNHRLKQIKAISEKY